MGTILLIILILLLVGALPTWPYSSGWGYYPSGGLGLLLLNHIAAYGTDMTQIYGFKSARNITEK
jgi:hypothetical protein